jgi:hypothetical protein
MLLLKLFLLVTATASTPPPGFSWDTLPVHWFSANATSQLSAATATQIASRHSLAIINGQGHAYWQAPVGEGAENKMVEAGRILKEASARLNQPPITVLAYFNSVLDWTAYEFHKWLAEVPTRYLHDINGNLVFGRRDILNNSLHVPDFSQAAVAEQWLANVVNTSQHLDGVFIDQGKYCSPFACKKRDRPFYPPGKLDAWARGHWDMLLQLRQKIPGQMILLNNLNLTHFPSHFDHEYENFNGSVLQFQSLVQDEAAGRVATCHNSGKAGYTTTLPLFLLGAGNASYYAATFQHGDGNAPGDPGWMQPAWDGWRPEYSRKLGAPLGAATISHGMATRHFASGTKVTMNLTELGLDSRFGGCVYWSDGNVTGKKAACQ